MDYRDELANVVATHRPKIEDDLAGAREAYAQARAAAAAAERRVTLLAELLAPAGIAEPNTLAAQESRMTLHAAMQKVLQELPTGMMRAGDLAAEINRRGLYRMRNGKPVEPQQIHARAGRYSQLFARQDTYIKLS